MAHYAATGQVHVSWRMEIVCEGAHDGLILVNTVQNEGDDGQQWLGQEGAVPAIDWQPDDYSDELSEAKRDRRHRRRRRHRDRDKATSDQATHTDAEQPIDTSLDSQQELTQTNGGHSSNTRHQVPPMAQSKPHGMSITEVIDDLLDVKLNTFEDNNNNGQQKGQRASKPIVEVPPDTCPDTSWEDENPRKRTPKEPVTLSETTTTTTTVEVFQTVHPANQPPHHLQPNAFFDPNMMPIRLPLAPQAHGHPNNQYPNHPQNGHPNNQYPNHPQNGHPNNQYPNHPQNGHPNNQYPNHPQNGHPNNHMVQHNQHNAHANNNEPFKMVRQTKETLINDPARPPVPQRRTTSSRSSASTPDNHVSKAVPQAAPRQSKTPTRNRNDNGGDAQQTIERVFGIGPTHVLDSNLKDTQHLNNQQQIIRDPVTVMHNEKPKALRLSQSDLTVLSIVPACVQSDTLQLSIDPDPDLQAHSQVQRPRSAAHLETLIDDPAHVSQEEIPQQTSYDSLDRQPMNLHDAHSYGSNSALNISQSLARVQLAAPHSHTHFQQPDADYVPAPEDKYIHSHHSETLSKPKPSGTQTHQEPVQNNGFDRHTPSGAAHNVEDFTSTNNRSEMNARQEYQLATQLNRLPLPQDWSPPVPVKPPQIAQSYHRKNNTFESESKETHTQVQLRVTDNQNHLVEDYFDERLEYFDRRHSIYTIPEATSSVEGGLDRSAITSIASEDQLEPPDYSAPPPPSVTSKHSRRDSDILLKQATTRSALDAQREHSNRGSRHSSINSERSSLSGLVRQAASGTLNGTGTELGSELDNLSDYNQGRLTPLAPEQFGSKDSLTSRDSVMSTTSNKHDQPHAMYDRRDTSQTVTIAGDGQGPPSRRVSDTGTASHYSSYASLREEPTHMAQRVTRATDPDLQGACYGQVNQLTESEHAQMLRREEQSLSIRKPIKPTDM